MLLSGPCGVGQLEGFDTTCDMFRYEGVVVVRVPRLGYGAGIGVRSWTMPPPSEEPA